MIAKVWDWGQATARGGQKADDRSASQLAAKLFP